MAKYSFLMNGQTYYRHLLVSDRALKFYNMKFINLKTRAVLD
ncbi:hypothetical protein ACVW2L_001467 [Mucilaginibacter sp. HD30]